MRPSRMGAVVLALVVAVVPLLGAKLSAARDAARMAEAARAFLTSLSADQRESATFAMDSGERLRFHFIPPEMHERRGVTFGDMNPEQRRRAHALLRAGLSQKGYLTATQVIVLEEILREMQGGGGRLARDPDEYFFTVFGTPDAGGTWGWRYEGHHVSLHWTVVDGQVTVSTPTFFGANPAEVREGEHRGLRILADQEDAGRELLRSLTAAQRATAVIEDVAPRDIVTGAELDIEPLSPAGLLASGMTDAQRDGLLRLIEVYASVMAEDVAARRMTLLREAGVERIGFAWAGSGEPGAPHYYRVQGPTFLIEYDNTQNDANHIHAIWRDFEGDFGRDMLREHRQQLQH